MLIGQIVLTLLLLRFAKCFHFDDRSQSISSVDMSYEVNTKPEAGPIERVVMQEDVELSGSDGSDERGSRGAGASATADDPAAPLRIKSPATDETSAGFNGISEDVEDLEAGERGRRKVLSRKVGIVGFSEDEMVSEREALQKQQEEYWGKGYGTARGGSPRRGSGAGNWGSPSRPCVAPRLSVDLIHVDPVGEAVKHVSIVCRHKGADGYFLSIFNNIELIPVERH